MKERQGTPVERVARSCQLAALAAVLAGTGAYSQEAPDPGPMNMETVLEFVDPNERISGGAVVGLVLYDAADEKSLGQIQAYFTAPVSEPIVMELATVDGRYRAKLKYDPVGPMLGWRTLSLNLDKSSILDGYDVQELALLMTVQSTGQAIPLRWGKRGRTDTVRVSLNSEGAYAYFAVPDEKKGRAVARACTPASKRSSFRFDSLCDIPIDIVSDKQSVLIIRKRGADFGKPITLDVLLKPDK